MAEGDWGTWQFRSNVSASVKLTLGSFFETGGNTPFDAHPYGYGNVAADVTALEGPDKGMTKNIQDSFNSKVTKTATVTFAAVTAPAPALPPAPSPLPANIDIWPYVYSKPGPKFTDSQDVKYNYAEMSAASINLEDYPEGNEMLGAIIYFTGPLANTSDINITFDAWEDDTNKLIIHLTGSIPTPASQGWSWWNWYKHKFWIGHAAWEINRAMKVRMKITYSGGGLPASEQTVYQEVKSILPPIVIPPSIEGQVKDASTMKAIAGATVKFSNLSRLTTSTGNYLLRDFIPVSGPITASMSGYETQTQYITAPETGTLTVDFSLSPIAVIPPVEKDSLDYLREALDKLIHLDFSGAWEAFIDGIKAPYPTDPAKNKEATDKLFEIMILALPVGTAEQIEKIVAGPNFLKVLEAIRKDPSAWAKLMPKFSTETKSVLMAALKKQADPTAYRLTSEALEAAAKLEGLSAIEKVLGILPGATTGKKLFIAFSSLVGAAAGYVGLAQFLAWTGKEAIKEAISFSGLYLAIDNKNWKLAAENLPLLKDAIEVYKKSTALARIIPFIGDIWEKAIEAAEDEYNNYKTLIEAGLAGLPAPKGTLVIRPTPIDAKVSVEGQIPTTGVFSSDIPIGLYTVIISKFGYVSQTRDLRVLENQTTTWTPEIVEEVAPPEEIIPPYVPPVIPTVEKGTLNLVIEPADAVVEVAGHPEINMSGKYVLTEGTYTIKASRENYQEATRTALVKAGVSTDVSIILSLIPELAPAKAEITIKSEPTNTDVYIDGEYTYMKTPATIKLDAGEYIIRCQAKGYYPNEVKVILSAGEVGELTVALAAMPSVEIPTEPYVPWEYYVPGYSPPATPQVEVQPAPYTWLQTPAYNLLEPATTFYSTPVDVTAPYARELILNVETTDVLPFKGRITSISWLDLSDITAEPQVITDEDEEGMLKAFLDWFDSKGFTRIIGFNVSFDHRFIFTKAALYRRPCKLWADIGMRDIMQILQQVQEKFVYSLNKAGTLDDWSKHLLGYGKYGKQEECLARWIRKDYDYVSAFNINQVNLVYDLYALLRYTLSEASIVALEPKIEGYLPEAEVLGAGFQGLPSKKKCPNCLQENPLENSSCFVCGAAI